MKPLIVANWKCNPTTLQEAKLLFNSVKKGIKNIKNVDVVICPPYVYLPILKANGTQDIFYENKGAYTGEISPLMLKNLGVEYVIVGHSERRALGETDEMINNKIKAALKAKLKPILCIGETEKQRKTGKTKAVLKNQLKCPEVGSRDKLIVAYEPVWAIGTGKFCPLKKAKEVLFFLRKILKDVPILYGGSVNSQNAREYIEKAGFNGLLVGGASLDAKEFVQLIKNVSESY